MPERVSGSCFQRTEPSDSIRLQFIDGDPVPVEVEQLVLILIRHPSHFPEMGLQQGTGLGPITLQVLRVESSLSDSPFEKVNHKPLHLPLHIPKRGRFLHGTLSSL